MKVNLLKLHVFILFFVTNNLNAQISTQWGPDGFVKIENGSNGMIADLEPGDRFSRDHDQARDINGDGVIDLAIGARSDDDGATDAGAVYFVFLNSDGSIQSNQKIYDSLQQLALIEATYILLCCYKLFKWIFLT